MLKYGNLAQYLLKSDKDTVELSFRKIEDILGFKLPHSAYIYNAWWANGGHSQSKSWLDAGYFVTDLNLKDKKICFSKKKECFNNQVINHKKVNGVNKESISLSGYVFEFVQQIIPECNSDGSVKKYYPQKDYNNVRNLSLLKNGSGPFCRFRIEAEDVPGVYLWVVNGEIVYIGETANLKTRFNTGYGRIYPRNCYFGGQSTNCKMNKVAMNYFENGTPVFLYFLETSDYKQIELKLLYSVKTRYNVKDN